MEYLLGFGAMYLSVFSKVLQQKNVIHSDWWMVMPTSMMICFFDVVVIANVASVGLALAPAVGIGGGLGCLSAMYVYNRFRRTV